jgi:hypothetical protein
MTNGELYNAIQWIKYFATYIAAMVLLFGGASVGFWLRRYAGGVIVALASMAIGTIILFRWVLM